MRFLCRRCLNGLTFFKNFQEFRFHMEYDHGLWFLAQTTDRKLQQSSDVELPPVVVGENRKDVDETVARKENSFVPEDDTPSKLSVSTEDKKGQNSFLNLKSDSVVEPPLGIRVDPFLETSWPTNSIVRLHEKEKQLHELQIELQLSRNLLEQMEAKVGSLQTYCQTNEDTIDYLNQSLLEKERLINENRTEIEHLRKIYEQNKKDNRQIVNVLTAELNRLIERSVVIEASVHDAHSTLERQSKKLRSSRQNITSDKGSLYPAGDVSATEDAFVFSNQFKRKRSEDELGIFTSREERLKSALMLVFHCLDPVSLAACTRVSRLWSECGSSSALWKNISFSRLKCSNRDLATAAPFCARTETMVFEKISTKNESETVAEHRKEPRGSLEPGLERLLQAASNSIKQIFIIDCDDVFTKRSVWLTSCYCRNLEKLVYVSNADPLNAEVLWSLGFGCRKLSALIVPPLHPSDSPENFTNQALNIVGEAFRSLRILCVGGNQIDVRGLTCIAKHCQQLQQLELDHVGEIRERTAITTCHYGFKGLLVLALTFTVITPKALLHFYRSCPNLETVTVRLEFTTYFPHPAAKTSKNKEKYRHLIHHIQILKNHSRLGEILKVFAEDVSR